MRQRWQRLTCQIHRKQSRRPHRHHKAFRYDKLRQIASILRRFAGRWTILSAAASASSAAAAADSTAASNERCWCWCDRRCHWVSCALPVFAVLRVRSLIDCVTQSCWASATALRRGVPRVAAWIASRRSACRCARSGVIPVADLSHVLQRAVHAPAVAVRQCWGKCKREYQQRACWRWQSRFTAAEPSGIRSRGSRSGRRRQRATDVERSVRDLSVDARSASGHDRAPRASICRTRICGATRLAWCWRWRWCRRSAALDTAIVVAGSVCGSVCCTRSACAASFEFELAPTAAGESARA